MWMFATTLRWNIRNRSFQDLQKGLLNTFTRHVSRYRGILIFATDLVDFIDVDNSLLCTFDIAVRCLKQFEDDVFDVFTNITSFSERGGIDNSERHAQHTRECLRKQSLAGPRGSDQEDVCLLNLD